jgi:hypothetical protein
MARDPIRLLHMVRLRSVEEARHALAASLKAEDEATARLQAIEDGVRRDRAAHQMVADPHLFQDMFALRMYVAQAEQQMAQANLVAVQLGSAAARAAVVVARTEAEGVATLIAERAAAAEAAANRAEQHALDDMARTRFESRPRQTGPRVC